MIVFVIPYRDRAPQKFFFENYMTYLMEGLEEGKDYVILFIEQGDMRPFNRGAMKNIGFIALKQMYPQTYRDIILVFQDIDVMPYRNGLLRFEPEDGVIMHHYGFEFALGGIVSMRAGDFERLNGFANYWSWGFEDNILQNRAQRAGIKIDRSNFFPLNDMRVLHINDGHTKPLNKHYMYELLKDLGDNGISTITNLEYDLRAEQRTVYVKCFETEYSPWVGQFEVYDIRNGRDIQAPITKEMMVANARLGNNLETLRFVETDGTQKTASQLLRDEQLQLEQQRKQVYGTAIMQVHPKQIQKQMQQRTLSHATKNKMMSMIRTTEDNIHASRRNDVQREQQRHQARTYGRIGLYR